MYAAGRRAAGAVGCTGDPGCACQRRYIAGGNLDPSYGVIASVSHEEGSAIGCDVCGSIESCSRPRVVARSRGASHSCQGGHIPGQIELLALNRPAEKLSRGPETPDKIPAGNQAEDDNP